MQAAQVGLQTSAHNMANVQTDAFHRQETVQTAHSGGGVDTQVRRVAQEGSSLETDVVAQLQSRNAFLANLAVWRTSSQLVGTLLDTHA